MQSGKIPYGRQWVADEDIRAVTEVLLGDWLTCGPSVSAFEQAVAEYCGAKYAVAVANGTAALHVACLAVELGPGHTGVTSPVSFVASANCIAYCGARPDFIDIDPATNCLSVEALEAYINSNGTPGVVIPVDFAGVPAALPELRCMADRYGFSLIEDAAHSLGSRYLAAGKWYNCGSCEHTEMAILSFHPVKTITSGEGGMILTNDAELARRARMFACHGLERDPARFEAWSLDNNSGDISSSSGAATQKTAPWLYQQQLQGYNYRISDIHCALGLSQLRRLDFFVRRRKEIAKRYNEAFSSISKIAVPPIPQETDPALHLYAARLCDAYPGFRSRFITELKQAGVLTQVHYLPIYLHPWFRDTFGYALGKCPQAEKLYSEIVSLPLYPAMNDESAEFVIATVRRALGAE